jgi:CHAD domain-containing protein
MKTSPAISPPVESAPGPIARRGSAAGVPRSESPATAHELALADLHRLLHAWHRHEPGTRLGEDPEELHQLRVTVRRVDATLSLFKHNLPKALVQTRKTGKGLLRALGAARDLDVQLMKLAAFCATLPEGERAAAEPLRERLEAECARAHARLARVLDAATTQHWIESLTEAGNTRAAADADSALEVLPGRVRQRYRKLRKTVRRLPNHASMEQYHEVRRRAKQLRYAIESGLSLFGKPAEDMLKALRQLQDRLGAHQDAHIACERLAAIAADTERPLPPATLFLMGRLAERYADSTSRVDKALERSWRRVRGKRWKALRGRLVELMERARAARRLGILAAAEPEALHPLAATDDGVPTAAPAPLERAAEPAARLMKH